MNPALVAIAKAAGVNIDKILEEIGGVVDELSTKQENAELASKLADNLAKLEEVSATADTKMHENYTKVLIADAQGQDKAQRQWRPHLAYAFGATSCLTVLAMLIVFPIVGVVPEPESWPAMMVLLSVFSTLLGVNAISRGIEKKTVTEALAGKLQDPLPKETKIDARAFKVRVNALKKAGLSPEQIVAVLGEE